MYFAAVAGTYHLTDKTIFVVFFFYKIFCVECKRDDDVVCEVCTQLYV